jgi:hypothetical protein
MAQVIRYVDTDVVGGLGDGTSWANAYNSLSQWEVNEETDLVADGDYHTVYTRASSGTDDTTQCLFFGWNTGPANYIEIIQDDFPTDAVYDDTKYVLHNNDTDSNGILYVREDYVDIRKLQVKVTQTGINTRLGIEVRGGLAVGTVGITFGKVIIKGVCSGTGVAYGIKTTDGDWSAFDCQIYGFVSGSDTSFQGIRHTIGHHFNLFNSTIYGNWDGIKQTAGTCTIKNCAIGNNDDDFDVSNATIDYCCSDDGDGTNAQNPSGGSWANEFNDPANGDFSLVENGNCEENGVDDPGSGLYSDDITDSLFTSPWDIGCYSRNGFKKVVENGVVQNCVVNGVVQNLDLS